MKDTLEPHSVLEGSSCHGDSNFMLGWSRVTREFLVNCGVDSLVYSDRIFVVITQITNCNLWFYPLAENTFLAYGHIFNPTTIMTVVSANCIDNGHPAD